MKTLPNYNARIQWSDDAASPTITATVELPDGSRTQFTRHSRQSMFPVRNGPLFTGGEHYTMGDSRFECFDDVMQKGLGLTKQ